MNKEIIEKINKAKTLFDYISIRKDLDKIKKDQKQLKVAVTANFTLKGLTDCLVGEAYGKGVRLETYEGSYGQWQQEIVGEDLKEFEPKLFFLILDLFGIDKDYFYSYFYKEEKTAAFFEEKKLEIETFIKKAKDNTRAKIILFNFPKLYYKSAGSIADSKSLASFSRGVSEFNLWLEKFYLRDDRVFVFDFDGWLGQIGKKRNWYGNYFWLADMRLSPEAIPLLAKEMLTYITTAGIGSKKCLVLDLDNTLWGGVLGEEGVGGIKLGPTGEGQIYYNLQKFILSLKNRGIILAINSKNNREDLDEVFKKHPFMVLKEDDFVVIKANWQDKVSNIKEIAQELNIGLDSLVFFDDDPINRELVKKELPEVEVIEAPSNVADYLDTLLSYGGFDSFYITEEDRNKSQMYRADKNRDVFRQEVDLESYLRGLELVMEVRKVDDILMDRAVQLTQKTNQFNLTTKRYQKEDMRALLQGGKAKAWLARIADRFGDYGFTALAITINKGDFWEIDTMLLSCRVLGRRIEEQFLGFILSKLKEVGPERVIGRYVKTSKNKQGEDFYGKFGFDKELDEGDGGWGLDLSEYNFDPIDFIKIIYEE